MTPQNKLFITIDFTLVMLLIILILNIIYIHAQIYKYGNNINVI